MTFLTAHWKSEDEWKRNPVSKHQSAFWVILAYLGSGFLSRLTQELILPIILLKFSAHKFCAFIYISTIKGNDQKAGTTLIATQEYAVCHKAHTLANLAERRLRDSPSFKYNCACRYRGPSLWPVLTYASNTCSEEKPPRVPETQNLRVTFSISSLGKGKTTHVHSSKWLL